MTDADFIAWAAEGHKDAMGLPMSDWLLARLDEDGRVIRDANRFIVYETQAEWLARNGAVIATPAAPVQPDLFA